MGTTSHDNQHSDQSRQLERRGRLVSASLTVLILLSAAIVCLLICYYPPDPPIPEDGVEVAMGFDEIGLGELAASTPPSDYAPSAAANEHATQSTESSIALPNDSKGTKTNPNATAKKEQEQKPIDLYQQAQSRIKQNQNGQSSGGQGDSQTGGQQGKPDGTIGSTHYTGNGGVGVNYNLKGRGAVELPTPKYNSNVQGKIVVKVWVNQAGSVTRIDIPWEGTTITANDLIQQSAAAARKAVFDPNPDATVEQIGYITYVFRIQ